MITIYKAPGHPSESPAGLLRGGLHRAHPHGFGALQVLDEELLPPLARSRAREPHDGEMLMYVRNGGLMCSEPLEASGVLVAGDIRREVGACCVQKNVSSTQSATIFWIGLRAAIPELGFEHELKHFTATDRRDRLRIIASPDGREDSLKVHQDVLIYSATLDGGRHVVHQLSPGRRAWLHLVSGRADVRGSVLETADAAAIEGDRMVSITAREHTELLLFDVPDASQSNDGRPLA